MKDAPAPFDTVAREAAALRRSHPRAPALDLLDLVMRGRAITHAIDPAADWLAPDTPFGQVIAEALDDVMPAADWKAWTSASADPELVRAARQVWATYVVPRFVNRYYGMGPDTEPEPMWRGRRTA